MPPTRGGLKFCSDAQINSKDAALWLYRRIDSRRIGSFAADLSSELLTAEDTAHDTNAIVVGRAILSVSFALCMIGRASVYTGSSSK